MRPRDKIAVRAPSIKWKWELQAAETFKRRGRAMGLPDRTTSPLSRWTKWPRSWAGAAAPCTKVCAAAISRPFVSGAASEYRRRDSMTCWGSRTVRRAHHRNRRVINRWLRRLISARRWRRSSLAGLRWHTNVDTSNGACCLDGDQQGQMTLRSRHAGSVIQTEAQIAGYGAASLVRRRCCSASS